jgi:amino acid adenylation domain-containing protein
MPRAELSDNNETCVHELFEKQAGRTPDAAALVFEDKQLSYSELNNRANQLARHLKTLGAGQQAPVAIALDRSLEMVVGLLGILKAGAAYLPLDSSYPKERLEFMLKDAGVSVLLTEERLRGFLSYDGEPIYLDADWLKISAEREDNPAGNDLHLDDLAYVIYTSGSTGTPKGVEVTHRAIVNRLMGMQETYRLTPADRVLQKTPFSFDVSVWEFFWPLSAGACLVMAKPAGHRDGAYLVKTIAEQAITTIHFVPSMLRLLLEESGLENCRSLKRVLCSGEALSPDLPKRFYARVDAELYNLYGPTEAAIDVSSWRCPRASSPVISIGRPVANTQIYLLDPEMRPVPAGVAGEIHIGGVQVARGYLKRPELTAEKFIPDPFSDRPGARLYKTGDLARHLPDGNIEFIGRLDDQVKVRGFRIELAEIETALLDHPEVRESVAAVREDEPDQKRLVAYVVAKQGFAPAASELRGFLKDKLPEYMLPSAFVILDALPLTPSGKLDRKALPALGPHRSELAVYVEPGTVTESLLAAIWGKVLRIARIGANDDFFMLGGDSLKATLVIARILDVLGVELSHRCFFEAPTLTALAERIDRSRPRPPNMQPLLIETAERNPTAPLSWGQTEIWLTAQLDPRVPVYNEPFTVYMNGPVDAVALERALEEIVRRHEILRTAYIIKGDQVVQLTQAEVRLKLSIADLGMLPEPDRAGEALRIATAEARRLFDLTDPPLLRTTLVRMNETDCRLYLTVHHIVVDAYSIYNVLIPELWQLYESLRQQKQPPLRELPLQYADYARWQRLQLGGAELEKCLNYWKNQLDGAVPLELPTDRPRPLVRTFRGAYQSFLIPKQLTEALNILSRREGVTLYMMLLAAFKTLLWRYTRQDEIVVGTAEAGRDRLEFEPLIGHFLNTLVMRTRTADEPTFRQFVQRVREVTLGAYDHRHLPFVKLVEELQSKRDPSRHPLFRVAFVIEPAMVAHQSGWSISQLDVQTGTSKFELTLEVEERPQGIMGRFEYNADLFDDGTIRRMIGHLQTLLDGIIANPDQRLSELPLLTEIERHQLLRDWNNSRVDCSNLPYAHGLFEAQAERTPQAVAVVFEDQQLTYRELNLRANQLAHHLRALGVQPEVLVAIYMERSLDMIIAVLGILKAGGAYVPLDPTYPKERLALMLADTQAPVLITQRQLAHGLIEDGGSGPVLSGAEGIESDFQSSSRPLNWGLDPRNRVVCLDTDWEMIAQQSEKNPDSVVMTDNLAYVIYTSGSMGQPKGVLVPHSGLCNLAEAQVRCFDVQPQDRILQFSSLSFDASIFEIVMAFRVGATLCLGTRDGLLPGPALIRLLRNQAVTAIVIPSSSLATLPAERVPTLRTIILAGEDCSAELVARWASGTRVFNAYGPTETTIWATAAECTDVGRKPPIGRPIANTQIYLLDAVLQPVPIGVPGELHIGGAGLSRGYLNRPDLTAERFIPNPFSDEPGARLYKTGDLARYLSDGNIEFLGRMDHQVKIRGFRVELGEIEAVLGQHAAVRETVVVARGDLHGAKSLVAYVVLNREPAVLINELRHFVKRKLPEYMAPSTFVVLDALPLASNGKVDRGALPLPDPTKFETERIFMSPRTSTEKVLAGLWAEILGLEQIGIQDNFFALGGHSLLATQVISRMRDAFRIALPLRSLFESPTVAGLAERLENILWAEKQHQPAGGAGSEERDEVKL